MNIPLRAGVAAATGLGIILVGTIGAVAYRSLRHLLETQERVEHTLVILRTSHRLAAALKDAESGYRGYTLSGNRRDRSSLPALNAAVPPHLKRLRELTVDNPSQQKRLNAMEPLIEAKLGWMSEGARARETEGFEAAAKLFKTGRGQVLMDQVAHLLEELQDSEQSLLAERRALSEEDARRTFRNLALMTVVALLIGGGWSVVIERSIRQKEDMEGALRDSLKTLTAFKAALDEHAIVAITDTRGKIVHVNEKFCAISMYPREELLGQDHRIINSGHHPKAFMRSLWETIADGRVWRDEIKNRAKDGSFYWVDTTIVPFFHENGKPIQYIAIRADITRRKLAEENVQRLNSDLQRRAVELATANKELESFSYSVSHDLRAPLRSIDGFSQAVLEDSAGTLSAESAEHLARVRAASQRMAQLIDDLLNLARVTRAELRRTTVDFSALAEAVAKELQSAEPGRAVAWSISPGLVVDGDEGLLRVVLQNFLGNAWKFTSKTARARIELSSSRQPDGSTAYFARDNGAGFDAAYAHKLFGAFQRLHDEADFPGTGVGLATIQRVIHRHGGRVWAESAIGKGATFYFTIPDPAERTS